MYNRGNTATISIMNISTPELLAYSTILEQIVNTNLEMMGEMSRAVTEGLCTKEEIQTLFSKSEKAKAEADETYVTVQKELDLRMKRDLGMKLGIRKTQALILEFDIFVTKKTNELYEQNKPALEAAAKIANETVQLNTIKNDN